MKTISIDAIRQRKVEIEAKIAGVIEANQKLYDTAKGENRDLTALEAGQFDSNTESMKPLKADLGRQDFPDEDLRTTALREAHEEIGLPPDEVGRASCRERV